MGKATVESSRKLDAHYWATPRMRSIIAPLAALFGRTGGRLLPEQKGEDIGLVTLEWHWTRDQSPAGSIHWAVQKADGDKARQLLLLFATTSRGETYPRRQGVTLSWETTAGHPAPRPVFLCPFCSRRCRFLCSAYPGRQGGPYLGEFACRTCAGLCYAKQLEYTPKWLKNFDAMLRLSDLAQRHPERLTDAHLDKVREVSSACQEDMDRHLKPGRWADKVNKKIVSVPEGRREWTEVPPPLYAPTRKRGRPSQKKARQQARACARFLREATRGAQSKRAVGRPKTRRGYNVSVRLSAGCAGRVGAGEGYCVGCRGPRSMADAVPFTASNGRAGVKGKCAECGRGLCRLGATAAT